MKKQKLSNQKSSVTVKSRYGNFTIEATARGLYRLEFPTSKKTLKKSSAPSPATVRAALRSGSDFLKNYFSGKKRVLRGLRFDLSGFTPLEQRVLKTLAKVPPGKVVSYGELAKKSGIPKGARFAGSVMRKNRLPVILPCHRVVLTSGVIGRYSGGPGWKERLLKLEGVKMKGNDIIPASKKGSLLAA